MLAQASLSVTLSSTSSTQVHPCCLVTAQVADLQQRLDLAEAAAAAAVAQQPDSTDSAQLLQQMRAEAEEQRQRCEQLQQVGEAVVCLSCCVSSCIGDCMTASL